MNDKISLAKIFRLKYNYKGIILLHNILIDLQRMN